MYAKHLIRGNTYRFDIESLSADGKPEWFDSSTGKLLSCIGKTAFEIPLDPHRLPTQPGHYRVYYTVPPNAGGVIYISVKGTIHSLPVVFKRTRFTIGGQLG